MRPQPALVAIFALVLAGCDSGPAIKDAIGVVKNGTLPSYTTKPVGVAFEGAFPGGKWTTYETAYEPGMGMTIVQLDAVTHAQSV